MASKVIGKIKNGVDVWEVKWDGERVYVRKMGGFFGNSTRSAGKARTAQEAMMRAEAYIYNR